jgi:hypothetical protein
MESIRSSKRKGRGCGPGCKKDQCKKGFALAVTKQNNNESLEGQKKEEPRLNANRVKYASR